MDTLLSDQNLSGPEKIWAKSRMCWVTLMWSKRAQKNEQKQNENSSLTIVTYLLLYSENFPWGAKTQYCQS